MALEQISGYIDHIIFRNEENGYTVLVLVNEDEEISCVGCIPYIEEGESVQIEGEQTEHPVYGTQIKIHSIAVIPPEDTVSIERYLGSGAIKGVGPSLASRIVKKFKKDTFRIIEEEPERLVEIKGISERIAREIAEQVCGKKELRNAMIFLQDYGITQNLAVKIYSTYGPDMYRVIKENPYKMADDIQGVGFRIADEIAIKSGIQTDSDFRIRSGVLYTMLQASSEGHTYLPWEELADRTGTLLGVNAQAVEECFTDLLVEKKIIIKEKDGHRQVYASSIYYQELNIAKMLWDMDIFSSEKDTKIYKRIERIEAAENIELDDKQRLAVAEAAKRGLLIITGGPGTGKTTTINTIIRYFESEDYEIALAAPTGRAAKRMTEATGYEARTIHRLLEINGGMEEDRNNSFERNEENPIEADVVIIDEMSMVDIYLMNALLKAVVPGTRLILVGDVDQLPSVGPGSVLRDIISSEKFPVVCLEKVFRQAAKSNIVVNAHRINEGKPLDLVNKHTDFFIMRRYDTTSVQVMMEKLIKEILPPNLDVDPFDIQVLTPMRKTALGVEALNVWLQEILNPKDKKKREKEVAGRLFREGDKVMQTKNNYQLEWEVVNRYGIPEEKGIGVFNGDIGKIIEINDFSETVKVVFDDDRRVEYSFKLLEELEHAYAITIHKSQGSEYPVVLMPLISGPRMLMNRNLLYTAVTRAKKCVTIVGNEQTVQEMIQNVREQTRYTGLRDRIVEMGEIEFDSHEN